MSKKEKEQWDSLYQYVKKEIMLYDDSQALSRNIVLGLKGLTQGKEVANNNIQSTANYSFELILLTFKFCKSQIFKSISGKNFKSDVQKFIYIKRIVENNINDVYERVNNVKKTEEKVEVADVSNIYHKGATYKSKQNNTKNTDKYKDMW